jgi:hypothetical protein
MKRRHTLSIAFRGIGWYLHTALWTGAVDHGIRLRIWYRKPDLFTLGGPCIPKVEWDALSGESVWSHMYGLEERVHVQGSTPQSVA